MTDLPIVAQLLAAGSDAERAQILLRLPDALVFEQRMQLSRACLAVGFRRGALYIAARISAFVAVRGKNGTLPGHLETIQNEVRAELAALACGTASASGSGAA